MEPVKYLIWHFLRKKLTAYSREQFPPKIPLLKFEKILNNTNFYFDESYCSNYEHPAKSMYLMQNTSPLFNKPFTPSYN